MVAPAVDELVDFYLPVLVRAGSYARLIQPKIRPRPTKDGGNDWTRALTNADIAVQNFIEVETLAAHPGLGFYGEEEAQSLNTEYFDHTARTFVYLDPVNGTWLYQNQQDGWDIVLSITVDGRLEAAISYMPAQDRFFVALRGRGALTGTGAGPSIDTLSPLHSRTGSRRLLTYRAPDIVAHTRAAFDSFDIVDDHDPARSAGNLNDLFTGELDAFAVRGGQLLDWGAAAFIAVGAGACISRPDGTPFESFDEFDGRDEADMLVSASKAIHEEILELLKRPRA